VIFYRIHNSGDHEESFLHCVRDCRHSKTIWHKTGFSNQDFFSNTCLNDWIRTNTNGPHSNLFLATLWWTWRHRNLMCLNNETWPLSRLITSIQNSTDTISSAFSHDQSTPAKRLVKWNCGNFSCTILNVDRSCNGTPIRTGFGGTFRNMHGFFLSAFSGCISYSNDILLAELTTIYHGLRLAKNMGIEDLVCYSNSLLSINLIRWDTSHYHVYAVLVQDIKDLLTTSNFSIHHTLREGNQSANFMTKLGAASDIDIVIHSSPPTDLMGLLRTDAMGTYFPRA